MLITITNKKSSSPLSLSTCSTVPGNRWPVEKQRSKFWPQSRATSTSTLTLQGHWSCRQRCMFTRKQQSLCWTQRCGLHICCGTTVGRGLMPLVFLHSHLLDFNQPKTLHFCYWNLLYRICFWFLEMNVLSLLVLLYYCYQYCIINGKRWLYNLQLGCIINSELWY